MSDDIFQPVRGGLADRIIPLQTECFNNVTFKQKQKFKIWIQLCRSQWPRGLRRRSVAACLLRFWVQIPPGAWMFVCCVLSGRGLRNKLITHPEESYQLWFVIVCDLETSRMRRPWPMLGRSATEKKMNTTVTAYKYIQAFNRHII